MTHPMARRLNLFHPLSPGDEIAIENACRQVREVQARRDLIREGDQPSFIYVMLDGWAIRYKMLENGRRQISAFLHPGDLFDLNLYVLREMDHSIGAVSAITVAEISRPTFEALTDHHPRITKALMWHQLAMTALEREWVANVGRRTAYQRISHLLCELFVRLKSIGMTDGISFRFPATQDDLADATGITSVHVNRTLGRMKREGLIRIDGKDVTILRPEALQRAGMFEDNYLHLHEQNEQAGAAGDFEGGDIARSSGNGPASSQETALS